MAEQSTQPIVIKRIKKGGHGHHGGAWKVAYADFVTAMMAFFLLLWLLSVTTPEKKAAIADYFTPTIGVKDSKGIGLNGGKNTQLKKGKSISNLTAPGIVIGQVQQGPVAKEPVDVQKPNPDADSPDAEQTAKDQDAKNKDKSSEQDSGGQDSDTFSVTEQELNQALQNDQDLKQLKNSVQIEQSPEGLKIDLIDDPKAPMFASGGAVLTESGKKALDAMANIIAKTPNQIAILGHTDAEGPISNPRYTNWELSTDRANAVRRALVTTQIGTERVAKVIGLADRQLLIKEEPTNPRNRRVTVILMRGTYARDPNEVNPASKAVLSVDGQLKAPEPDKAAAPANPQPAKPSIFDVGPEATKPAKQ